MAEYDQELDACGLNCPLPILRAKKSLSTMETGQILHVVATDPGAIKDFEAFSNQTGNKLMDSKEDSGKFYFLIQKAEVIFYSNLMKQNIDNKDEKFTGAEIFVKCLEAEGIELVFGYPGGAVLHIYDELHKQNEVSHILVRHEQGAVHAAEGFAKSSNKPGVVLVTSGPGATNSITGIADAVSYTHLTLPTILLV